MTRTFDGQQRIQQVSIAMSCLLTEEGAGAMSVRAIARRLGISHAALIQHVGSTDRLIFLGGAEFFTDFVDCVRRQLPRHGREAFFPGQGDVRRHDGMDEVLIPAWCAWTELARTHPSLRSIAQDRRAEERYLLGMLLSSPTAALSPSDVLPWAPSAWPLPDPAELDAQWRQVCGVRLLLASEITPTQAQPSDEAQA